MFIWNTKNFFNSAFIKHILLGIFYLEYKDMELEIRPTLPPQGSLPNVGGKGSKLGAIGEKEDKKILKVVKSDPTAIQEDSILGTKVLIDIEGQQGDKLAEKSTRDSTNEMETREKRKEEKELRKLIGKW